jgi:hypothetical protein
MIIVSSPRPPFAFDLNALVFLSESKAMAMDINPLAPGSIVHLLE